MILAITIGLALPSLVQGKPNNAVCKEIEAQLPGKISYPSSAIFKDSLSSYYSGQEEELVPECIFSPQSALDVSSFIKVVTKDTDSGSRIPFAIRSGGHAVFSGAANIHGGITVDLRGLDSVHLSEDKTIASIGGGAVWHNVYPRLVPHNLTVMGGRVSGVGVGGFLTGGGINFLSRKHGWACDDVVSYEIVLANGDIVEATGDLNSDLWLALKGGSNNFGVVTRFDLKTRPLSKLWGGDIIWGYSQAVLDAQAHAFSNFMKPQNFDDAASLFVALIHQKPDQKSDGFFAVGNVIFYTTEIADPPIYKPFTSISSPLQSRLRLTNTSDLIWDQAGTLPPHAKRSLNMVYSFRNPDSRVYTEIFRIWEDGAKSLDQVDGLLLMLLIQPHPVSTGQNSLGLPPGQKDLVLAVITVAYSHTKDDVIVRTTIQGIIDQQEEVLQNEGVYIPWKYLNYADNLAQDPIASYGEDVKTRLRAVSVKFDPKGVFQSGVPGGFKLFGTNKAETKPGLVRDEL